ncbi:hypothetical protein BV898_14446 [Hypsibius exemplaris]|uniref:Uncharacterized protein n=1 Tax=Hypsibius exemplaris TaxID=2072580 RepID=A0A9X6RJF3_HYPEX|nr:hypothetical protein BV898_14446 [Hypsibius exemplaris]
MGPLMQMLLILNLVLLPIARHEVLAVIQVELACPDLVSPLSGNGALAYHRPAYETAVEECNRIYEGRFNFTMTFMTGNESQVQTNPDMKAASMDILSE